ncbi:hypothetical protein SAMN04488038_110184 [Solimonas aquatica]|uniref:DUF374 domain-containing protein n=1 Tax=Solimonas aquatica TaxID=489703 RepID=A0A1H9IUN1_9GAMM|nr:lysophospholipid acyltransferase family protein [Solimonas aquatica]SEQ78246.1 hypothetical protein SAMN04488038_110184 [Solimonas aquatica]
MPGKMLLLRVAYLLVRVLASSYRFRSCRAGQQLASLPAQGYVLAIWHQNLFGGILAQTGVPHCVMISRSSDGAGVAYICERLGHRVLRGSSRRGERDKGGKQAKDEMIEVLKTGLPGAITVDGPCGPAHEVKPGIIEMARLSRRPIVPYLTLPRRYWSFPSWDAFRLPKPFTRVDVCYGAPIDIPADTSFAQFAHYQQQLTEALLRLESTALAARDA